MFCKEAERHFDENSLERFKGIYPDYDIKYEIAYDANKSKYYKEAVWRHQFIIYCRSQQQAIFPPEASMDYIINELRRNDIRRTGLDIDKLARKAQQKADEAHKKPKVNQDTVEELTKEIKDDKYLKAPHSINIKRN